MNYAEIGLIRSRVKMRDRRSALFVVAAKGEVLSN